MIAERAFAITVVASDGGREDGEELRVFPIQRDELESLLRGWRLWTESWGVNRRIAVKR